MLLLLFMLPAHAQDTAIITPENVHLVALEHVVIPTGSRLDTVIYAPAADLVAMTGIDLGIYICQTDQPYTDDLTGYEPPFALRLFRGCQNIRLSDGGSMKAMSQRCPSGHQMEAGWRSACWKALASLMCQMRASVKGSRWRSCTHSTKGCAGLVDGVRYRQP